jgi:prepilin-type N-terminal cleavage/methylation domain-containing protein
VSDRRAQVVWRGRRGRRMQASGFTLLEIMVALAVGGVALSSIYAVGAASTRHFREQQRISATQTSLRTAMDQLKRDFQRAGFLATPNVRVPGESCGVLPGSPIDDSSGSPGTGRLAAISTFQASVKPPDTLDPDELNKWATVDQVILMGNYSTSGEYSGIQINAAGTTVTIPNTTQSFARDFSIWAGGGPAQCNFAAFASAFAIGRLVRIHSLTERVFFARVTAVTCANAAPATVTLDTAIPLACNASLGWIAPVNTINIQAAAAAGDEISRTSVLNRVTILRRTEVMPDSKAAALTLSATGNPIDDRSILDYLVSFRLRFMLSGGSPNSVNFAPTAAANVRQTPESLRGVIIDLSSRTAEQEPEFDAANLPQGLAFKVLKTPGGARVRSLHAELLLPNIAYRGY